MLDTLFSGDAFADILKELGDLCLESVVYYWNRLPRIESILRFINGTFAI